VQSGTRKYPLDAAELAANRAFPLHVLWPGGVLANGVLALGATALIGLQFLGKEQTYAPVEYDLLAGYLAGVAALPIAVGMTFLQLYALQALPKRATTFWAGATIIVLIVVACAAPVAITLFWIENGPNLTALLLIPELWLLREAVRGWLGLARLCPSDRDLVRLRPVGLFTRDAFSVYLGIPLMARFLGEHKWITYLLFLLGTFFAGLFFTIVLGASPQPAVTMQRLGPQIFLLIALVTAAPILLGLGNTFTSIARVLARQSIAALTTADRRPPILFLRAFRDDQVILDAPDLSLLSRLISLGLPPETLDSLLVEEATAYGPLVALGNPRDPYPPYGAARGYFEHKDWQTAVRDLLGSSRAVILCMDDTESVAWELKAIVELDHLDKALLLVPPKFSAVDENAEILGLLLARLGENATTPEPVQASATSGEGVLGLFYDRAQGWEVLTTKSFSRQAYLMALRRFLRCKFGLKIQLAAPEDRRTRVSDLPATVARPVPAIQVLMRPPQALLSVFNVASLSLLVIWIGHNVPWLDFRVSGWLRDLTSGYGEPPPLYVADFLIALVLAGGVFGVMRWMGGAARTPSLVAAGAALTLAFVQFSYLPPQYFIALVSASIAYGLMRWIRGSSRAAAVAIAVLMFAAIYAQLEFAPERRLWTERFIPWLTVGPTGYDLATLALTCAACVVVYLAGSLTAPAARRGRGVLLVLLFGLATLWFTIAYRSCEYALFTSDLNQLVLTGFNVPELFVQFYKILLFGYDQALGLLQSAEAAAVVASLAYGLGLQVVPAHPRAAARETGKRLIPSTQEPR